MIEQSAGYLSDAGYEVIEIEPPSIQEPARGWFTVLLTELKGTLGPTIDQYGSDDIRNIFGWYDELGKTLNLDEYRAGLGDRSRMMRAWNVFLNDHYPLVLTPFLMRPMYSWNYDARGIERRPRISGMPRSIATALTISDCPLALVPVSRWWKIFRQAFNWWDVAIARTRFWMRWRQSSSARVRWWNVCGHGDGEWSVGERSVAMF